MDSFTSANITTENYYNGVGGFLGTSNDLGTILFGIIVGGSGALLNEGNFL